MDRQPSSPFPWKNLIIAVLFAVVVVQAWQARLAAPPERPAEQTGEVRGEKAAETRAATGPERSGTASGDDAAHIVGLNVSQDGLRLVLLFDKAVGGQGPTEEGGEPATLAPAVPGRWSWSSPFALLFEAETPLPAGAKVVVTVDPARLSSSAPPLASPFTRSERLPPFQITDMRLDETSVSNDGGVRVRLRGQVQFSHDVSPEDFIAHVRLDDPAQPGAPVPLKLLTDYQSRSMEFVTPYLGKTTQARSLRLTVDAEMAQAGGGGKLGEPMRLERSLGIDPILRLTGVETAPRGKNAFSLVLRFSAPVGPARARELVSVTPKTSFRLLAGEDGGLILDGEFKPRSKYEVSLGEGLPGLDGSRLPQAEARVVETPPLAASVAFADPGLFLTARGTQSLSLESVNAQKALLRVDRVYPNNLFYALSSLRWSIFRDVGWDDRVPHLLGDRVVQKDLALPPGTDAVQTSTLPLGKLTDAAKPGLYRAYVSLPGAWEGSQRWICITDIGLAAKLSGRDLFVWATRLSDLGPAGGVSLRVVSSQNQTLAQGAAGPDGLWRVRLPEAKAGRNQPFMILAERGQDFSFLLFEGCKVDMAGLDVAGASLPSSGLRAFAYGERDIWRPGETVKGALILRGRDFAPPPPVPLGLSVQNPLGRPAFARTLTTDAAGWASFEMPLPEAAPTGGYTATLKAGEETVGQYRFQVEEFVPDRIRVELLGASEAAPGQDVAVKVRAAWLFGAPAKDLPVEVRGRLEARPFAPKGFEAYRFGCAEDQFEPRELAADEGRLNESGEFATSLHLPDGLRPPAALGLLLAGRVREQGGRGVTALKQVLVHAYPAYPGIKALDRQGFSAGQEVAAPFVWITPDGKPAPDAELVAELVEERWQTVLRRAQDGSLRYDSVSDPRVVQSRTVRTVNGKGEVAFTPPGWGGWRIVLRDPSGGAAAEAPFWVSGWGAGAWAMRDGARVDIRPDKADYRPGEVAIFQIRAPFPGKALVTLERDGVFEHRILDLTGNTGQASFPIRAEYAPNVYVTAMVVRQASAMEPGGPGRAFGAVPVSVNREAHVLAVAAKAPSEARPGRPLTVTAQTRPGARLSLAVVDEGVLRLAGQKTPDPFGYFLARRALDVQSYDIFSLLFPEPRMDKARPGGGMSFAESRYAGTGSMRRAKPVAYFSGPVTANDKGVAEFTVTPPEEFQGAVRVMAVAADGPRFGAAETEVRLKSPIVLLPSFPRFLAPGDRASVPVVVRNDTGRDGTFAVRLSVEGTGAKSPEPQQVAVAAGKEGLAVFEIVAPQGTDGLRLIAQAEGNGETARASDLTAVRPAAPPVAALQGLSLTAAETRLPFPALDAGPAGIVAGSGRRELVVGREPVLRFAGQLARLLRYPYGCAEQVTSTVFPLLHLAALAKSVDPKLFAELSPQAMVQTGIGRVMAMQTPNGGFAMWPGGGTPQEWISLYVAHFLVEAGQAGYGVGPQALQPAIAYAGGLARSGGTRTRDLRQRAYACFITALAGQAERGGMDALREKHLAAMPPDARALLAGAYALTGEQGLAAEAASFGEPVFSGTRQTGGDFDSPLRGKALCLLGLMRVAPGDARLPALVEDLSAGLSDRTALTTQEAGLGFAALGRYLAARQARPAFSGTVELPDGRILPFDTATPLSVGDIAGEGEIVVRMQEGYEPGAALLSLRAQADPASALPPAASGLALGREFLDRQGSPADLSRLRQGDVVIMRTTLTADREDVDNVAVVNLLPAGLEVENPRLATTERLEWMAGDADPVWQDLRDDRVVFFADARPGKSVAAYTLLRVVTAGSFAVPAPSAEAMYDPALFARGEAGTMQAAGEER